MSFIVATNVYASRLPELGPTGTPTARASYSTDKTEVESVQLGKLRYC